jgi:hypothetical protein
MENQSLVIIAKKFVRYFQQLKHETTIIMNQFKIIAGENNSTVDFYVSYLWL